ncbi:MAG: T9SS type A sorting domain-containing protein [Candidatus Delongbacteria bacterium]|nr:T9SS type A sorting domain-containing protein [Candidatus Delongbacteria bacterium]
MSNDGIKRPIRFVLVTVIFICYSVLEAQSVITLTSDSITSGIFNLQSGQSINLNGHSLIAYGGISGYGCGYSYDRIIGFCSGIWRESNEQCRRMIGACSSISQACSYSMSGDVVKLYGITHNETVYLDPEKSYTIVGMNIPFETIINGGFVFSSNETNSILQKQINLFDLAVRSVYVTNGKLVLNNVKMNRSYFPGTLPYLSVYGPRKIEIDQMQSIFTETGDGDILSMIYNCHILNIDNSDFQGHIVPLYLSGITSGTIQNTFFCSNENDISVSNPNGGTITSYNNTYSRDTSLSLSGNIHVTGTVNICSNLLDRNGISYDSVYGLTDCENDQSNMMIAQKIDSLDEKYRNIILYLNLNETKDLDYYYYSINKIALDYINIINIVKNPELIIKVLERINYCCDDLSNYDIMINIINELYKNAILTDHRDYLHYYLCKAYLGAKNIDVALREFEEIRKGKGLPIDLYLGLIFDIGRYYNLELHDVNNAEFYWNGIIKGFPDHGLSRFALQEIEFIRSKNQIYQKASLLKHNPYSSIEVKCRPNPFTSSINIDVAIPSQARVTIEVFNIIGLSVTKLTDEIFPAGKNTIQWYGKNSNGENVASGIYLCKILINDSQFVEKILYTK